MKRTLIIGGTGLIGPHLVKELEIYGHEVVCINRSGKNPSGGKAFRCDRNNEEELRKVFSANTDFHLIDMIPYSAAQAGTLLNALDGYQPFFTAISSIDVYLAYNILHNDHSSDEIQSTPLRECSELRERLSFQGIEYDKLNVEKIYWSYFNCCSIVRLPAVYGLPDVSRIEKIAEPLFKNERITLNPSFASWRFSRSLNSNCAHAIALTVDFQGREIFNIAEPVHFSEKQWSERISTLAGIEPSIHLDSTMKIPYGINTQQDWFVDSSKIRAMLGYTEKYDTDRGIQDVLAQIRLEGTGY